MKPGSPRPPAWAGQFYPAHAETLRAEVKRHLEDAVAPPEGCIKAVIAPHAGYRFSGPIAGSALAPLARAAREIQRIVLLGPSHRVPFSGVALCSASGFETPLGCAPLQLEARESLARFEEVSVFDLPHEAEHSLEVEVPFLQMCLGAFELVPLVVGEVDERRLAEVVQALWGGRETRFVISSDLSHFLDYRSAQRLDRATARAIEALRPEAIQPDQACGGYPLRGFLHAARERGLTAHTVDLRNSGDTAGPRAEVVGYGAFAFAEPVPARALA